jgi:hypothetical protein
MESLDNTKSSLAVNKEVIVYAYELANIKAKVDFIMARLGLNMQEQEALEESLTKRAETHYNALIKEFMGIESSQQTPLLDADNLEV